MKWGNGEGGGGGGGFPVRGGKEMERGEGEKVVKWGNGEGGGGEGGCSLFV